MRWVSAFLALASIGALQANAQEATIFTFPAWSASSTNRHTQQQTITEDEARLVLELRMKPSLASNLGKVDADTVDRLNYFAQNDLLLFGGNNQESPQRSLVLLEGIDQHNALTVQEAQPHHLHVPQISSSFIGLDPLEAFIGSTHSGKESDGQHCTYSHDASTATSMVSQSPNECLSKDSLFDESDLLGRRDFLELIDSVESWTSRDRKNSALKLSFKSTFNDSPHGTKFLGALLRLAEASSNIKRETTILVLPPGIKSEMLNQNARRSGPATQPNTMKRSAQGSLLQSSLTPVCHASNSSCAEATNNCSGHGFCYLKYGAGVDGTTGNCYTCQCQSSTIRNSDGTTKTVQWGGPSCQKRDISSPFFLVAGVSVLAIIMAGSAIGMLFSMGAQELPSVISAGVGGPKSAM